VAIDGQPLSLATGDCLLVEPGERHRIANTGSEDLVLLYFGLEIDG
jgi:mannose-6-phosphate isomerase-like protein (cupin superfamily)